MKRIIGLMLVVTLTGALAVGSQARTTASSSRSGALHVHEGVHAVLRRAGRVLHDPDLESASDRCRLQGLLLRGAWRRPARQ